MKKIFLAALISLVTVVAQAASYYTVGEIMEVYNDLNLSSGSQSTETYTVRGYVTRWSSGYPNYQNADFFIDDSPQGSTTLLKCFRLTAQLAADKRTLQVGEYVEVTGKLMNYNGKQAEIINGTFRVLPKTFTLTVIAGKGGSVNTEVNGEYTKGTEVTITATPNADYSFVQWSDGNTSATRTVTITEDLTLRAEFKTNFNTVADIMKIYQSLNLASGASSSNSYTGRGYVTKWYSGYPTYQNATFYVDDYADGSTSTLQCYRLTASNAADKRTLKVGEYVEFTGKLMNYTGKAEIAQGGTFRVLETPQEEEQNGCYTDFEGMKGAQIIAALHEQIKEPDTVTYKNLRADLTGIDYRADGTVWDMYSDCSFGAKQYCYSTDVTEACNCYNREHVVPQSYWANDNSKKMRTDLFNVIPADAVANETRSAWAYGEVTGTSSWTNGVSTLGYGTYGNNTFEPADEYKGDLARVYFYMLTCYRNEDFTQRGTGSKVFTFENGVAGLTSTALSLFLKWHRNDPVSEKEINRNNGIERLQGNRNPYVDMPELVEYIWGKNAAKTYVCASTAINQTKHAAPKATKLLENGTLYLVLPDGTRYTTTGVRVR